LRDRYHTVKRVREEPSNRQGGCPPVPAASPTGLGYDPSESPLAQAQP